jgi:demethylmenaquinone methyltransferase/2-methoxy-6-polyprenyl-1,4-benzoquinol methylase
VNAPTPREPGILAAPPAERRAWVRATFHDISRRYDLLNTVLSGGMHLVWKRVAVREAGLGSGGVGVDVGCGTGDLVQLISRSVGRGGRAIGLDFAPGMLAVARYRLVGDASLVAGDAEALPLAGGVADAVTFAFALRNVARPEQALCEALRVLRPDGRLIVLEFGQPRARALRVLYDLYSHMVIPRLGGWLSGRRDAYQYLHDSIRQWVDPDTMANLMRRCGFTQVRYRSLTGGIAILHVGHRPRTGETTSGR